MERTLKDYLLLSLKGICMGAADVVPGVSGGTIAFIVGIYDELIDSIKSINAQSLKKLFTGHPAVFWRMMVKYASSLTVSVWMFDSCRISPSESDLPSCAMRATMWASPVRAACSSELESR